MTENSFPEYSVEIYNQNANSLAKFSKMLGTAASGVQVLGAAIAATTALGALMKDNLGADFAALEGAAKRFGAEVFESVEKPMRSATQVMTAMLQGMTGVLSSNELMERIRDHRTEIQKMSDAYEMQKIASDAAGLAEAAQIDYAKELFVALKELCYENGKVKEGDEARAAVLVGLVNEALGTEITLVDGQIQKYGELCSTIDDYIAKKRAQVLLDNKSGDYAMALETSIQLGNDIAKYEAESAIYEAAFDAITPDDDMGVSGDRRNWRIWETKKAGKKNEELILDTEAEKKYYDEFLADYEAALAAMAQGNYADVQRLLYGDAEIPSGNLVTQSGEIADSADRIAADWVGRVTSGITGAGSRLASAAEESFAASKEYIENAKFFDKMSLDDELAAWERVRDRYAEGSKQRMEAEKKVYTLKKQLVQEEFNTSKEYIERQKELNQMSLAEELAAWERVQQRYLEGSEERAEADKKVYELRRELREQEEALEKEYADALRRRTEEIMGVFGLFGEAPEKKDVSADDLLADMSEQKEAMQQWSDSLAALQGRGVDAEFLAEVRGKGPEALGEVQAVNAMTDAELLEYVAGWQMLKEQAKLMAEAELADMRAETDRKIAELWGNGVINSTQESLETGARQAGVLMTDALAASIGSGASKVVNSAVRMAAAAIQAVKSKLDINSPSRQFAYIGQMVDEGFAGGIMSGLTDVKAAVNEVFGLAAGALLPTVVASGAAVSSGITREVHNNTRTVEKVAQIEGDGLTGELVRLLRLRLKQEDKRVGAAF